MRGDLVAIGLCVVWRNGVEVEVVYDAMAVYYTGLAM